MGTGADGRFGPGDAGAVHAGGLKRRCDMRLGLFWVVQGGQIDPGVNLKILRLRKDSCDWNLHRWSISDDRMGNMISQAQTLTQGA
jgi:hypothetical protein